MTSERRGVVPVPSLWFRVRNLFLLPTLTHAGPGDEGVCKTCNGTGRVRTVWGDRNHSQWGDCPDCLLRRVNAEEKAQAGHGGGGVSISLHLFDIVHETVCGVSCPSVWKTGESQPHCEVCKRLSEARAAVAEVQGASEKTRRITELESQLAVKINDAQYEQTLRQKAEIERDRLLALINTPEIESFLLALQIEAAHQRNKWGDGHDENKSAGDWALLRCKLLGKLTDALWKNERDKYLHHLVTMAAVCFNEHRTLVPPIGDNPSGSETFSTTEGEQRIDDAVDAVKKIQDELREQQYERDRRHVRE